MNTKSLLTTPSIVLPKHLKQTFPPIIWVFTEGEGDGIKSRLPFKKNYTLPTKLTICISWIIRKVEASQPFSAQTSIIAWGPFIYYVSTWRGEGGSKIVLIAYYQYKKYAYIVGERGSKQPQIVLAYVIYESYLEEFEWFDPEQILYRCSNQSMAIVNEKSELVGLKMFWYWHFPSTWKFE